MEQAGLRRRRARHWPADQVSTGSLSATLTLIRSDLAVADFGVGVIILQGDGAGGFAQAAGSPLAGGSGLDWLAIGDFNVDQIGPRRRGFRGRRDNSARRWSRRVCAGGGLATGRRIRSRLARYRRL